MSLLVTNKDFSHKGNLMHEKKPHQSQNSGNNEWYTPNYIIDAARKTMGSIDLDPASSAIANQTVMAKKYYTKEDDGLKQRWFGNIWLNPPYSRSLISQFSSAVINRRHEYDQAIVLVNNATETRWFQYLLRYCTAYCIFNGRIKFLGSDGKIGGSSMQGQIILYYGTNLQKFEDNFSTFGILSKPMGESLRSSHTAILTNDPIYNSLSFNSEYAA
jgi:ParB family chromosome partitioning protein